MEADAELSDLLREVISVAGNITRERYLGAFRLVYHLCDIDDSSEKVYRLVRSSLREDVQEKLKNIQECPDDKSFLRTYRDEWQRYFETVTVLERLLHPMDRLIVSQNLLVHEDWRTLKSMAFGYWRENALSHIKRRLIQALLRASDLDRKGKPVFSDVELTTVVEAISKAGESTDNLIQIYEQYRTAYIVHLEELFWINSPIEQTAEKIIMNAQNFISEELPRARKYLRRDDDSVTDDMERFMFANNPDFFMKKMTAAISALDLSTLRRFYDYLKPMGESREKLLRRAMINSVPDHTRHLFDIHAYLDEDAATLFVDIITTMEQNYRWMIEETFDNDRPFDELLLKLCKKNKKMKKKDSLLLLELCKSAVETLEVIFTRSSAELVAEFYDKILDSEPGRSVKDIEQDLDRASKSARYVVPGADFQAAYIDLLRERLTKGRWSDIEVEKRAVDALGEIKGEGFIAPIRRILTDIVGSKVINQMFQSFVRKSRIYAGDFEVIAISSGIWQFATPQSSLVKLPVDIENTLSFFECAYPEYIRRLSSRPKADSKAGATECQGRSDAPNMIVEGTQPPRKLTWFHDRAQAEIEVNLVSKRRSYLVKCSAFTAIVLLLFEDDASRSISDVRENTKLSASDLRTALEELERTKLLKKIIKQGPQEAPRYVFNPDFEFETSVVDLVPCKALTGARKQTTGTMSSLDQTIYTEALLMRILKKHRALAHDKLIELFKAGARSCRLDQDDVSIAKCLNSLESKCYIESDSQTYRYVP